MRTMLLTIVIAVTLCTADAAEPLLAYGGGYARASFRGHHGNSFSYRYRSVGHGWSGAGYAAVGAVAAGILFNTPPPRYRASPPEKCRGGQRKVPVYDRLGRRVGYGVRR